MSKPLVQNLQKIRPTLSAKMVNLSKNWKPNIWFASNIRMRCDSPSMKTDDSNTSKEMFLDFLQNTRIQRTHTHTNTHTQSSEIHIPVHHYPCPNQSCFIFLKSTAAWARLKLRKRCKLTSSFNRANRHRKLYPWAIRDENLILA